MAALVFVLAGAFTVSASSTWLLGERHHLENVALPALILVLEVGSITGAAIYVITRDTGTRRRAGLLVAIATGVGATGGVQAYGFLIGLPVAALLLLMVDMIGRFWHETDSDVDSTGDTTSEPDSEPEVPEPRPSPNGAPLPAEPDEDPDELPTPRPAPNDLPHPDEDDEPAPLPEVPGVEPEKVAQVAELLSREPLAGRPRVRDYVGITDYRAGQVLAALRPLRAVGSEAS